MTKRQFRSWVRFLLDALEDMEREGDPEKKAAKLAKIIDNLQEILE